jgi:hypothetical protein
VRGEPGRVAAALAEQVTHPNRTICMQRHERMIQRPLAPSKRSARLIVRADPLDETIGA